MPITPVGPCPAKIMIVGEFPGESEMVKGVPFVGAGGMELSRMLQEAGIMRSECFITNVIRERPPANDIDNFIASKKSAITNQHISIRDKFVLPVVRDGMELLKREIEMCQPNVIIALGNVAMWALTGKWGITSWRSSLLQTDLSVSLDYQPKVIPAYNPTMILRQWNWRQIMVHDLRRAKKESLTAVLTPTDYAFTIRPDFNQVMSVLGQMYDQLEAK